ncbi:MAG TPA: pantoate--beta-alanine ligase [bacterium]|nr:pantoate--beta-alanine ligase [bacterium]HQL61402.1 pantoate--beta-alanine ligase [bacterium]
MDIIRQVNEMMRWVREPRAAGKEIGVVPTMGYLHEGHLSLCRLSLADGGRTVVTVFVNPTQFGPGEDLARYPRDEERDLKMLRELGISAVFLPTPEEMYPPDYVTYVETGGPSRGWCGATRPTHFRGVTTVISQMFHITQPNRAYFGQKDAQQVAVLKQMVRDLKFPIQVIVGETVREPDGLAMSSRNTYLTAEDRKAALVLFRALQLGRDLYKQGEHSGERLTEAMRRVIAAEPHVRTDYIGVVNRRCFRAVEEVSPEDLLIGAIYVGSCRLIDNLDVSPQIYPLRD